MVRSVLLIDDPRGRSRALEAFFQAPDWRVVGEARTAAEVATLLGTLPSLADLALIDVRPNDDGLALTQLLCTRRIPCIVVVAAPTAEFVESALSSGALAVLAAPLRSAAIREAIESVLEGRRYVCPKSRTAPAALGHASGRLTPRETEVLALIAAGKTSNAIALQLHIAPRTVGTHRERLTHKLGVHNVADLTREALRRGL